MPVEFVTPEVAKDTNVGAGLAIKIEGERVQPYAPRSVLNGDFKIWLAFGRKSEDGAHIAVLHIVQQDEDEPEFNNWAYRQTYLENAGFAVKDASVWMSITGRRLRAALEIDNGTDIPVMIMGSAMHQVEWWNCPEEMRARWHEKMSALPENERPEHPPYVIATQFIRLCVLEPSVERVNAFMKVRAMGQYQRAVVCCFDGVSGSLSGTGQ